MTKLETAATAATWVLMNALAVLLAIAPVPSHSPGPGVTAAGSPQPASNFQA